MIRYAGGALFGLAALIALGWCFMSRSGNGDGAEPERAPRVREEFAAGRAGAAAVPFDGDRAMGYLKLICKIGPRQSGSDGMKKQQEIIQKHFEGLGATVEAQRFIARQISRKDRPVEMTNLIVSWFPERRRRVVLCSHYDTRPIADQEPNRRNWDKPFVSANDGGSGVALLMELGHHMKGLNSAVGVDFVFFDGEEYIFDPGDHEGFREGDKYFFGSEHFAQQYRKNRPPFRYINGILFDMIAGKNVMLPKEQNSKFFAAGLVNDLWSIADEKGCKVFVNRDGDRVNDDHLALNQVGIPTVDLIDFKYPHWHKLSDTPENCSSAGMVQVAQVITTWLQRVK